MKLWDREVTFWDKYKAGSEKVRWFYQLPSYWHNWLISFPWMFSLSQCFLFHNGKKLPIQFKFIMEKGDKLNCLMDVNPSVGEKRTVTCSKIPHRLVKRSPSSLNDGHNSANNNILNQGLIIKNLLFLIKMKTKFLNMIGHHLPDLKINRTV